MFYSRQDAKTQKSAKKPGWVMRGLIFTIHYSPFTIPAFATGKSRVSSPSSSPRTTGSTWVATVTKTPTLPNLDAARRRGPSATPTASANAPVCAPARCTLLLGDLRHELLAPSNMRSFYKVSSALTPFHHPLQKRRLLRHRLQGETDYNTVHLPQRRLWNGHAGKGESDFKRGDKFPSTSLPFTTSATPTSHAPLACTPSTTQQMDYPIKQLEAPSRKSPPTRSTTQATRDDWGKVYSSVRKTRPRTQYRPLPQALSRRTGEADNTIIFYMRRPRRNHDPLQALSL